MIVRWGLGSLEEVLAELSVSAPLLITEELWKETELPVAQRFHGARPHAEITGVREATALAQGRGRPGRPGRRKRHGHHQGGVGADRACR